MKIFRESIFSLGVHLLKKRSKSCHHLPWFKRSLMFSPNVTIIFAHHPYFVINWLFFYLSPADINECDKTEFPNTCRYNLDESCRNLEGNHECYCAQGLIPDQIVGGCVGMYVIFNPTMLR